MIAIYVCLTLTGFVLARCSSNRGGDGNAEAWARAVRARWWSERHHGRRGPRPLALTVTWLRPRPLIRLGAMGFFALPVSVIVLVRVVPLL
jgi:hypothetical protein